MGIFPLHGLPNIATLDATSVLKGIIARVRLAPDRHLFSSRAGQLFTCRVVMGHPTTLNADFDEGLQPFWLPVPHSNAHGFGGSSESRTYMGDRHLSSGLPP